MRRSRILALAAAGAFMFSAAGCGGGYGSSTPTSPSPPSSGGGGTGAATNVTITITGQGGKLAFNPNPATIAQGQLVVFKNNDSVTHHVVLDDGSVQTPDIAPGATSAPVAMGLSGSPTYHCTIHPGMVGGFNGAVAEPPPNCNQAYCLGGG
jgi:plastocyanin